MLNQAILNYKESAIRKLCQYIEIPGISITGEGIDQAARFAADVMKEAGINVCIHQTGGNPIVTGEIGSDKSGFTLLIYGHYDVFPAEKDDSWHSEPFSAYIDGERIWGRGSGDNKGQHLAWIFAVKIYQRIHGEIPFKIKFLLEGEEETGSKSLAKFALEHKKILKPTLVCYSDGPMFPNDQVVLLLGVRGILCLEFSAAGSPKPLHSGNYGGVAENPVLKLCHLFSEMASIDGGVLLPAIAVPEIAVSDQAALKRLPFDREGIERNIGTLNPDNADAYSYYFRLMCQPYINISAFNAGYSGDSIKTIIPNQATAKMDIRLVGGQDPDTIYEKITDFVKSSGMTGIKVKKLIGQPPSKTPIDHPLITPVKNAVRKGFGIEPLLVPSLGATTPDYVFTKILEAPSVVVPFAPYDENNHVANESTKISIFLNGIKTGCELINELAAYSRMDANNYSRGEKYSAKL